MKAALLILALLALAACAAAPRAAAQEDRPIPKSCNAVEEKWSYLPKSYDEDAGGDPDDLIKTVNELKTKPRESRMAACCSLCKKTRGCKSWEYRASNMGYGCSLYKPGAERVAFEGCKCTQVSGSVKRVKK